MSEVRGSGREWQAATAQEQPRGATLCPRSGAAGRSHPVPEARGGSQEEQPHTQGAVAAWVQEGLQELFHIQGEGAVFSVRRYPSSKVRSTGCILL